MKYGQDDKVVTAAIIIICLLGIGSVVVLSQL